MPRKRRASITSLDDEDFMPDEKYSKDDGETRAPRNAANARERARMRVLSKAFCRLKTTLPWVPADTKLSKLDTLRLAATYIAHLRAVLREDGDTHPESTRSLSLALVSLIYHSLQSLAAFLRLCRQHVLFKNPSIKLIFATIFNVTS